MSKTITKQHDITDCGATCLASVAAHHNLQIPIARIHQYDMSQKRKYSMLEKANKLWEYYDKHSKEYSLEREQNIAHIKQVLENAFPAKKLQ